MASSVAESRDLSTPYMAEMFALMQQQMGAQREQLARQMNAQREQTARQMEILVQMVGRSPPPQTAGHSAGRLSGITLDFQELSGEPDEWNA